MKYYISTVLLTMLSLLSGCDSLKQCEDISSNYSLKQEFVGVIKDIYIKESSHGSKYIVLSNNKEYGLLSESLACFAFPGDSILKRKGDLRYIIKRNSISYTFYPECGNWEIKDSGRFYNPDLEFKTSCKIDIK